MKTEGTEPKSHEQVSITLKLSKEVIQMVDKLKMAYGAGTRGRVIELLLEELLSTEE